MKEILLGLDHNFKMAKALVDDEDFEWLNEYIWGLDSSCAGRTNYAIREITKKEGATSKGLKCRMHHVIMGVPITGLVVDHINRNSLDNRRCNLRFVTTRENNRNTVAYSNNIYKRKSGWQLGMRFATKEEALLAREAIRKAIGI